MVGRWFLNLLRDSYRFATFRHRGTDSRGVFGTFEEAIASAPTDKPIGYDHAALARHYRDELEFALDEYDYPILFHLAQILDKSAPPVTILDFGGNIGVHYLRYRKHLALDHVTWIVCDVPAITAIGREICEGYANVRFINELSELEGRPVDVVLAAGSIQFCCVDFAEHFIVRGELRPRHVLISQVILYGGPAFVTLQNGGYSYYPQHIYNRDNFISAIEKHGMAVVDQWLHNSSGLSIPFHSERSVPTSSGIYFAAADSVTTEKLRINGFDKEREQQCEASAQPFFSVLIATYNRAALLSRAIHSVLKQSFPDFELIVIDDGSTDNTAEVVHRIKDSRIRFERFNANMGQSLALNAGIDLARGEFIAFLDSDDEWLPTYLEEVSQAFSGSPDAALVYTRYEKGPNWTISGSNVYAEVLRQGQLSATSTLNFKAAALRAVGGFRDYHSVCNDDDLCFRIAKRFAICHLPRVLTVMHATPDAVTSDPLRDAFGWAMLVDEYRDEMLWYCGHHTLAYHCLRVSELMFGCFQLKRGGRYLVRATTNLLYRGGPLPAMDLPTIVLWYARIARASVRGLRWRLFVGSK